MVDETEKLAQAMYDLGEITLVEITENLKQDPFDQQKIYEKWIKEEEWQLREQGIPLAIGLDPEKWKELFKLAGFEEVEEAAWEAIKKLTPTGEGPNVLNPEEEVEKWKVNSTEFYRWLNQQGISVPDALDSLMQFVMTIVKKPVSEAMASDQAGLFPQTRSSDREKVLGAAFNIVSKEPNACRDDSGLTNGSKLAEMIAAQSVLWFESSKPPMSVKDMSEFLEKWLE
ncbi:MAG: hypothetical protein AB8D52_08345 [Gammaproteobacteria bacterium]